ncbi:HNH endonuclease [Ideonella sp.]|uniref:HNH endonuclease n=1 Tax=Ideonella sp. TaxID=1929293 RepID=UPI0035ADBACB
MPDIANPVELPPHLHQLVEAKLADPAFTHRNWADEDLVEIRSFIRKHYRLEQRGKCAYCKRVLGKAASSNCHVEHLLPKSLYLTFLFEPKNLCAVCAECNTVKRAQEAAHEDVDTLKNGAAKRYPRSSGAFKIVHPHFDVYKEHIDVLRNKFYVPKTPKGYFTVAACDLNAHLREFGWQREFVDEDAARKAAQRLIQSKSASETAEAIRDLQESLLEF